MKIRIISDLHLEEFSEKNYLKRLDSDKESVLIIAGDLCGLSDYIFHYFFKFFSKQFKYIFYIAGNHEYYNGTFKWSENILSFIKDYENVYSNKLVLEREKIAIIGKTLWTDFRNNNPLEKEYYRSGLNDCGYIRDISPDIVYETHKNEVEYIFNYSKYYSERGFKVIVVSHHLPSYQSIDERYKHSKINSSFASDLDTRILESNINTWIHGHTHVNMDYMIGNTRILCNPYGYNKESTSYKDNLVIEV